MRETIYPLAPEGIPSDFTKPTSQYRLRTLGVLAGLFAFLLIYLFLIAAVAYLGYLLATHPPPIPKGRAAIFAIVAYVGGLAAILMLFLFLFKGLFKSNKTDRSQYLKLKRSEHPQLFDFIDRLCLETAAPTPAGVFISPDVNAAVFYDTSLLNLVIPPKKYLLIGAGLVQSVNLREFKAVLAHEFGHFSQKSLAIGSYVWVANRVLGDMIYSRDAWDNMLRHWCSVDIRLSFPAWILRGTVWVLRSSLGAIFKGINLLNLSLSRQMEFNADDVAVSVAGSDAIVTTLCKVEFADRCFEASSHELKTAADHKIYSRDIFHQMSAAAAHVRKQMKKPQMGIPPKPPAQVFDPEDDTEIPAMWRSHPANHEREANAKRSYYPADPDERSPWILFQNAAVLKKALSYVFYEHTLNAPVKGEISEPDVVQSFIEAERAETHYDPKYHGLFDDRALKFADIPSVPEVDRNANAHATRLAFFNDYPRPGLERAMAQYEARTQEISQIIGFENGVTHFKGKPVTFRGKEISKSDIPRLLKKISKELETDHETFGQWDREMYVVHYQAAHQLDPERAIDLRRRYVFLQTVQTMVMKLNEQQNEVGSVLENLQSGRELGEDQFRELVAIFRTAREAIAEVLYQAKTITCPEMSNVGDGTKLISLIQIKSDKTRLPRFDSDTNIEGEEVGALIESLQQTLTRLRRVFFKGLGNILTRQERIAADYLSTQQEVVQILD
ncbi:MAG: M48 family metallopeptidase [Gemmataceae bacterium]